MKDYALRPGVVLHGSSYDYTIEKVLGNGTFGITYLAGVRMKGALGSLDADMKVAIKEFFMRDFNGRDECSVTCSSKDGAFAYYKSKFVNEAKNLSRLHNPGIIKVIELFEENQTSYYVMEYLPNGSFDEYIASRKSLTPRECIDFTIQICDALAYMHGNRMLHLDLKPSNIMLDRQGRPVLIDFGLSKRFDQWGNPDTSTTVGLGTPGYAPMEQANYHGYKDKDFPATMDVYALGATMFKMLTGHRPPEASIVFNDGFPDEDLRSVDTPDSLVEVVRKCMQPARKDRYKTMEALKEALLYASESIVGEVTEMEEKGFYKKASGESEYGTYRVDLIPVTSAIKFPESIRIRLWENNRKGRSYDLFLTGSIPPDGDISLQNSISVWEDGELICEDSFAAGIPADVRKYIVKNGLLSTVHWENEYGTTPLGDDFGTDVMIEMIDSEGKSFVRRVMHAHKDWHSFLLETVQGLLYETSLKTVIDGVKDRRKKKSHEVFVVPDDADSITVDFEPARIGVGHSVGNGFHYRFHTGTQVLNDSSIAVPDLSGLIKDMSGLGIEIGDNKPDLHDYSEAPAQLSIVIRSKSRGEIRLWLKAFNIDMIAGNIYNADIRNLAESLEDIMKRHIPKPPKPKPGTDGKNDETAHTDTTTTVFMMLLISAVVAVIALPTYFFVEPSDDMYYALWGSLGVAEIFLAFLFCIGDRLNDSKEFGKLESVSLSIGFLGVGAYIVFWIIQMCKWWL